MSLSFDRCNIAYIILRGIIMPKYRFHEVVLSPRCCDDKVRTDNQYTCDISEAMDDE